MIPELSTNAMLKLKKILNSGELMDAQDVTELSRKHFKGIFQDERDALEQFMFYMTCVDDIKPKAKAKAIRDAWRYFWLHVEPADVIVTMEVEVCLTVPRCFVDEAEAIASDLDIDAEVFVHRSAVGVATDKEAKAIEHACNADVMSWTVNSCEEN